jgi:3',5'-cyclic AMP phosphodiesterase CpdA
MDCLLAGGARFRSSLGNHDILTDNGRPELEEPAFGMPARNYVVRRAGVRFVVANSNDFRMRWLGKALEPEVDDRWTVAVFHHPVFSAGDKHGSTPGLSEKLHGLFVDKGVDLVLTGHDHVYSVSENKEGIRYVVTGGGGARGYGCEDSDDIELCLARLHFLYVRTTDEAIAVQAVSEDGEVIDRFRVRGSEGG